MIIQLKGALNNVCMNVRIYIYICMYTQYLKIDIKEEFEEIQI